MTVQLARSVYAFGEGVDVALGNQLKLYVFDQESGSSGVCVYSGYISLYLPETDGSKEVVSVTFLGYWTQTNMILLEDAGATTVAYGTQSPLAIITDLLTKFNTAGGKLTLGTSDDPGTSISYTFNCNTFQEALVQCVQMSPYTFAMHTEADDKLYLKLLNTAADHVFHVGRSIANYKQEKRSESIVNTVYFTGGGTPPLYKKYVNSGSVSAYGTHAIKMVDGRVTVTATADAMANKQINLFNTPEIRITMDVIDSNCQQTDQGYDIESIKPGDTCKILGATSKGDTQWDMFLWDGDVWDYSISNTAALVLTIWKVTYYTDHATLEISNRQPDISQRIEQINNALIAALTVDNPATPAT